MKEYSKFKAIDFAKDDEFLRWTKYSDEYPETDKFWQTFLINHPEKTEEMDEAKRMILSLVQEGGYLSEQKQREVWQKLQNSIQDLHLEKQTSFWSTPYKIAAAILFLMVSMGMLWVLNRNFSSNDNQLAATGTLVTNETNNGSMPKTVLLRDGSSVILQPQSSLEYSDAFNQNVREVKLAGEAFFEVAKDARKPFMVYAENLVTKVLGTSFTIRAFQNEGNILVQVKTGKVSVFTESDVIANKNKGNAQLEGVLLTPNQQVVFSRGESSMVKSIVENPVLLNSALKQNFEFKDTPLREVFNSLEQAYGIEIIYDEETMQDCELNASLEDMPLYDKLRLICKGVNASYEILDAHIVITGKGCK